jgi:hypothetical protein
MRLRAYGGMFNFYITKPHINTEQSVTTRAFYEVGILYKCYTHQFIAQLSIISACIFCFRSWAPQLFINNAAYNIQLPERLVSYKMTSV